MWISSLFAVFWNWKLPVQRYLVFAFFLSSNLSFSMVYLPYFGARTVHFARYFETKVHLGFI